MTDNQTTELLREGLTEHGIEWRSGLKGVTFVGDWCFVEYVNGKLAATCEPALTPKQAIAATLGDRECVECAEGMGRYADSLCDPLKQRISELKDQRDVLLRCLEDDWHISASWDGLRKFWCIELTEEGVRMRDSAHGTLTAEQVRECVGTVYLEGYSDGSANRGAHVEETDWQAIADELNAATGEQDAIAFCKRVEKAVARRDPLTLFGVDYSATAGCGECEFIGDAKRPPKCNSCGYDPGIYECAWLDDGTYEYERNYCPNCGKAVKR